eukprot:1154235-Pelagomonas_calceolata.AAC.2
MPWGYGMHSGPSTRCRSAGTLHSGACERCRRFPCMDALWVRHAFWSFNEVSQCWDPASRRFDAAGVAQGDIALQM